MGEMYRSAFTENDLINTATVACVAGQYNKLGEYKVEAGEAVALGFGAETGQESAQGRIYALIKDDANTAVNGVVRLSIYSPQNRPLAIVEEYRTETINAGSGDRTKQLPLALHNLFATEDRKIVLEFNPDASKTVSKANSDLILDITKAVV